MPISRTPDAYESVAQFGNHIAVVHASPQIWKIAPHIHARLVVPVRQIVEQFVVGDWLARVRCAVECCRVNRFEFTVVVHGAALALVVAVDAVAGVADAQLEVHRLVGELFIEHRRLHDGREQKELLHFGVRRLGYRYRWLDFDCK